MGMDALTYHLNTQLTYLTILSTPTWWKQTAFLFMKLFLWDGEKGASAESSVGLLYYGGFGGGEARVNERTNEEANKTNRQHLLSSSGIREIPARECERAIRTC